MKFRGLWIGPISFHSPEISVMAERKSVALKSRFPFSYPVFLLCTYIPKPTILCKWSGHQAHDSAAIAAAWTTLSMAQTPELLLSLFKYCIRHSAPISWLH